ncbi:efflux RND transporter periplasmic adaptor subunit [Pseudidiomarina salinarum]|uniref:efflux RND transporter periplasmic adaptor subunit n=1 Tax=Pseudidiomarina salinarum TaxID=435908 RepID=UPI00068A49DA|nr:efflux RND transporter periplasmic adaptor subunit [Pseudidiomarina salinarum]RUO71343.1 efflux RND transporter periplasmic adaptor subunit [Pseudidiomarina salinarum]
MLNRYLTIGVVAIILCAQTGAARAQQEPVVSVVPVERDILAPTVMVTGQVISRNDSSVSAGIKGKLEWILEPGIQVEEGDIIARLDARPYQLTVRQLDAKLRRKTIEIETLRRNLERFETLHSQNAVSGRDLDDLRAELALAETDYELLQIQLEEAQDNLDRTAVVAPFTGIVVERFHQRGEDVNANQSLVKLVDPEQLEIRFHGPLQYSAFTAQAEVLEVYDNSGSSSMTLRSLIPMSDANSQTFTGHLVIPEQSRVNFQVGEFVSIAVPAAFPDERFVVPRDAIVLTENGAQLFVLDADNKASSIRVHIDGGQGDYVNVKGNLNNGQRVIVRGADTLRNGQTVRVLSAAEFPLATLIR